MKDRLEETANHANGAKKCSRIRLLTQFKSLIIFLLCCFTFMGFQEITALTVSELTNILSFDQETDDFLKAKELVFKGEWHQARIQLERYLVKYTDGSYRDEALYWLARSLNKLSNEEVIVDKVIALKEEAAAKLDILLDRYPKSLWLDDGVNLRLSLAAELDFMGREGQYKVIQKLLKKNQLGNANTDESAMAALLEMRPEAAVTLIKRVLEVQTEPKPRQEMIAFLGQHFYDEAKEVLRQIAQSDEAVEVRREANYWIDRHAMSKIPTQLLYFGYSAEINDKKEMTRIPERRINFYKIPRVVSLDEEDLLRTVNRFFNQKLSSIKFVTAATADLNIFGMETSNNIQGFNFKIYQQELEKNWDKIRGRLRFRDNSSKREYHKEFVVEEKNDQILAMRKNNGMAVILFHFARAPEEMPAKALPLKPFYHTEFTNVLGCRVLSTRGNFSMKEISKEGAVSDFGQAKAEIPGKNGTWILQGNLIVDRFSRKFIARGAELKNVRGKVVAKASQIIVPVDHPEKFEVAGKK